MCRTISSPSSCSRPINQAGWSSHDTEGGRVNDVGSPVYKTAVPLTECGTYLATRHFGEAVGLLHRLLNQLIVLRKENMRYG